MVNVPWDQALDTILKTFGLGKVQEGSIIRVVPVDLLRKERDDELQSKRVVEELEAPVDADDPSNYAQAEELKSNMEKLIDQAGPSGCRQTDEHYHREGYQLHRG